MSRALIARATDRGLGYLTKHIHDGLEWDRVIVFVNPSEGYPDHLEWYLGATVIDISGGVPLNEVALALVGVDVLFSCETLYDWSIAEMCDDLGIRTVVLGMSELVHQAHPGSEQMPHPTEWCWPTDWIGSFVPDGPILPVPSFADRPQAKPSIDMLNVVHVAGRIAKADRNGTDLFLQALNRYDGPDIRATLYVQEGNPKIPRIPQRVHLDVVRAPKDRWSMYAKASVMVMPRRYGGLSLPVLEAVSSGVPVMMTQAHPNQSYWPTIPITARNGPTVHVPTGRVPTHIANPGRILQLLRLFAERPHSLDAARREAVEWAEANTWDTWRPRWDVTIGR